MRVIAFHVIITAYGFWLPNDPRGSWSRWVRAWELAKFGPATKVSTHRSLARKSHDIQQRLAAKRAMVREAVLFSGEQARTIAQAFGRRAAASGYAIHACTVLPAHAHLVLGPMRTKIQKTIELLKAAATTALIEADRHPFQNVFYRNGRRPTPWARGGWNRFCFTAEDVRRSIRYVQDNPLKEGLRRQAWSFVTPYEI
ncbi:hypothetical protein HED60_18735 [Planctomycetales bacterium ZRK34]|nr:hypothetical protein HED60_18735 [Planctomycetales bacterium ZRK34]